MLPVLLNGSCFQPDIVFHPLADRLAAHYHMTFLEAGLAAQFNNLLRQPVQMAHLLPRDGLNLAGHFSLAHGVGVAQILANGAMFVLQVFVEQGNNLFFIHLYLYLSSCLLSQCYPKA